MKLVLSSSGFESISAVYETQRLAQKPLSSINIAIINEAYAVEEPSHRWVVNQLGDIARFMGGTIDFVNLLALDRQAIMKRCSAADVIYVMGGHTDYLAQVFQRTGFTTVLPKLLESTVYVGSSAGAMVIGRRVGTPAFQSLVSDGCHLVDGYLDMVNIGILPHFDSPHFAEFRADQVLNASQGFRHPLYCLPEDASLVIDGDPRDPQSLRQIGTPAFVVRDGVILCGGAHD